MKTYRTARGPFAERPYYEDSEIESMCVDALRGADLLPSSPQPIRIDRFIEKRFGPPAYEDLPNGVLGLTRFNNSGVQQIVVAKILDDESSSVSERRIRTTLAHEAGHGLMHTHLFVLATPSQNLFGDFSEPSKPKVLCREDSVGEVRQSYSGEWWEFQANRAIGSLLLPAPLMRAALVGFMNESAAGFRSFDHLQIDRAARELADVFDVNPAVARLRIIQMFPNSGQLTL